MNIYIYVGVEVMCYVNRGVGCQLDATANQGGPKQRKDLDPTAAGAGNRVKFIESI